VSTGHMAFGTGLGLKSLHHVHMLLPLLHLQAFMHAPCMLPSILGSRDCTGICNTACSQGHLLLNQVAHDVSMGWPQHALQQKRQVSTTPP
jgi:hypothetical protein